jgi:dihydrofolate synthase/folylpolyglutamate synthase
MQNEKEWTNVDQAISWIHSLLMLGEKPGLKRMEWMLERLNHPERRVKFIHVGGTNGKGSTVAFLRNVLQEAGHDVGSFTSPYIERFQNRIQLNGQDIADQDLLELTQRIRPLAEELAKTELGSPTEFEVVTMIAILYYATVSYPDYVLWEVGLGGRLDSTNVVMPILSIITNVGFDHIHILGEQIEQIAFEKAGIIKPGVPVVTGSRLAPVLGVLKEKAREKKASFYAVDESFQYEVGTYDHDSQTFSFQSMFKRYEDVVISLQGKHQLENASVAIMALEVLKQYFAVIWDEEHLRQGFQKTFWIGRMEKINQSPLTIMDGAHNPEGMAALRSSIDQYYHDKSVTVMFSAMKDKDIATMLQCLDGAVDRIILTQFDFPRAATVRQLIEQMEQDKEWSMEVCGEEDWQLAYQNFVQSATNHDVLIITGSLYFISEVRNKLKNKGW